MSAGSYSYNISDDNGCLTSGSVSINQPNPLTAISSNTDVSCNGGSNGTAEINSISGGVPPYSTNWFGADTNNLNAGSYSYSVSDNNGCSTSGTVSINQPNPLTAISSSTDVSCNGGNDGTAEIFSISGGVTPSSCLLYTSPSPRDH